MSTQVYSNADVFLGKYDIGTDMSAVAIDGAVDTLDKTAMGATTRTYKAGLRTVGANMEGFFSPNVGLISPILEETYFATVNVPFTVIPAGYTENARTYSFLADIATWNSFGGVGEMMKFRATAESCGVKLIGGYCAFYGTKAAAAVTTSTSLTITGGAPVGYTIFGALHIFSASAGGDTLDVIVQNDAAGWAHPTTALTFTQETSATANYQWQSHVPANADHAEDCWRIQSTVADGGGGVVSFTYAVFFGIMAN